MLEEMALARRSARDRESVAAGLALPRRGMGAAMVDGDGLDDGEDIGILPPHMGTGQSCRGEGGKFCLLKGLIKIAECVIAPESLRHW